MKKKTTLLATISAFAITLSGAIIALPKVATADADNPYTIKPIEDLIDTKDDVVYHVNNVRWTAEENEMQVAGTRDIAVYTEKATTDVNNKNNYDGNITTYVSSATIHGLWLDENWNTLTKLRVNYSTDGVLWFAARKSNYTETTSVSAGEGYSFRLGVNASNKGFPRITKYTKAVNTDNTKDTVQEKTVKDGTNLTSSLTDGQSLEIVFGAYDVTDVNYDYNGDGAVDGAGTYLYFEIIDVETGDTLSLIHVKDTIETTLLDGTKNTSVYRSADNQKNYMQIIPCINTNFSKRTSFAIEGIYEPILNSAYDYTLDKEYAEGTIISELELPNGYAIQDGQELVYATYSLDGSNYCERQPLMKINEALLRSDYKGRIYIRQNFQLAEKMPLKLLMEKGRFLYVTVNGREIALIKSEFDVNFVEADITVALHCGENVIEYAVDYYQHEGVRFALFDPMATESVRNCLYYDTYIENIYLQGDFIVDDDFVLCKRTEKPSLTECLQENGYPFFKGVWTIEGEYIYDGNGERELCVKGNYLVAELYVNGTRTDLTLNDKKNVTQWLQKGNNQIIITLRSSIRNLFGPHHYKDEGKHVSTWTKMFTFRGDWINGTPKEYTHTYTLAPFGVKEIKIGK